MYLTTFLAAFLCGLCVYLAVKCFGKRRLKPLGIIELVFFVFTFVYCGFEHCIANMFYFSQANAWSWNAVVNIIIVVIGNSVGTLPGIALWKIAGDK
jgi:formate/nitrite transporter FocA (FNT family)